MASPWCVEELIRADMKAHGKNRLPMGGSASVEWGVINQKNDDVR